MSASSDAKTQQTCAASWLEEHGDVLYAYALARVKRSEVAEDLVQETLLAAISAYERFEGQSTIRTWLTGILRHKILNPYRSRSKAPLPADDLLSPSVTEDQFGRTGKWKKGMAPREWTSSENDGDAVELGKALSWCLGKLPPRVAEAFVLGEQHGIPVEEIGKMLGITATNVYVMRHRARAALRRCLEHRWFGEASPESGEEC